MNLRRKGTIDEDFQDLIKDFSIPIYSLNRNMEYIAVNKEAANLVQKRVRELLGKEINQTFPGFEQTEFGKAYRKALQTRSPKKVKGLFKLPHTQKTSLYEVQILPYNSGIVCIATDINKVEKELEKREESENELKTTKTRLDKIKKSYEILIENVNDFIAIINSDFRFGDINKVIHYKKLGYRPEELLGKRVINFVHPEDRARILPLLKQAFQEGSASAEFRFKHKNKSWIWMEAKGKTFEDEDGRLKGIVISRDITKRKRREQEQEKYLYEQKIVNKTILKLSRIRDIDENCHIVGKAVKKLNESAIIIVSLYSRESKAITIRTTLGLSNKEEKLFRLLKNGPEKLVWDETDISNEKHLYTTGKLESIPGGLYTLMAGKVPKRVCKKLEETFNIIDAYTVGFALDDKPYGGITLFLPKGIRIQHREAIETLASHISVLLHKRQAERQLLKTKKRYQEIFEGSRDGFVMVNSKGQIIDANNAYCEMLGYTIEELRNLKDFYSITPKRWHKWEKEEIWERKLMRSGYSGVYEKEYIRKDGTIFPVELQSYTIFDENNDIEYLWGVARDITERKEALRKVKESEKKYRALFNNMSSGVAVYRAYNEGEDFIFRDFNLAAEEIDNIEKNQLIGKKVTEVFPDVKDFGLLAVFRRVWKTGEPEHHPLSRYEDERIAGWRKNYVYKLPNGEIVAVYDDVTKEKIAKQRLNESERKYRLLFETMAQGVMFQNKNGQIISANPAAEEILGITIEDMKMKTSPNPDWDAIKEDGSPFLVEEHPSMVALKTGQEIKNVIMGVFQPQKKEYRWLNVNAVPQFSQGEDLPYQVYTTFEDITDRIRAEQRLKESEKKYREIAELLPDIIYEADRDGRLTYINSIGFEKLGYREKELKKGINIMELIAEEYKKKEKESIKKLLNGERNEPTEYLMVRSDGSKFYARIHSRPVYREEKIVGIRGTVSDINKMVLAQEKIKESEAKLKHLNKLKSELLRRTSHELKTPLISIKGFTNLILEQYSDDLDEDILKHMHEIGKGCERLEGIIEKILETAQLESGKMKLKKEEKNLTYLIKISVESFKGASEAKNHLIILNIHEKMIVNIEREKILEVIENLLSNAIKFTPSSGIIRINSKKTQDKFIISIKDNGIGFTSGEKSVLFTQFGKIERYGHGFDVGIDGTGLGLYISKKIIKLHGGNIWMESEGRNKGSTFYFSLPRAE